MALRKTARALETENELLQEEKMKIIKDQDRIRNNLEATIKDRQTQVKPGDREVTLGCLSQKFYNNAFLNGGSITLRIY